MAKMRKLTIGVMPFAKMFRVHSLAGAATDAVLELRNKGLPESYFVEVGSNAERTAYRVSSGDQSRNLHIADENIAFVKDVHDSDDSINFRSTLDEFRIIWGALQKVLAIKNIRRIGMVAEYRFSVKHPHPSVWLRDNLLKFESRRAADKFSLRFEEREFAKDGLAPDPKKADYLNYIYHYYDSAIDASHPNPGFVDVNLDVQRYFAPLLTGDVISELSTLHRHFQRAEQKTLDDMKRLGASDGEQK